MLIIACRQAMISTKADICFLVHCQLFSSNQDAFRLHCTRLKYCKTRKSALQDLGKSMNISFARARDVSSGCPLSNSFDYHGIHVAIQFMVHDALTMPLCRSTTKELQTTIFRQWTDDCESVKGRQTYFQKCSSSWLVFCF